MKIPTLSVRNLTKSYKDADRTLAVISGLNYVFPDKGSIAVIGRSGVGKSTFLHLLAGLDKPSSGAVLYGETDISALDTDERAAFRAGNIGFVFQFHNLLPEFSALENAAMPSIISGVHQDESKERARELLTRLGLKDRISHRPGMLSGGEQQRVAIARALVTNPSVILADEPTGNLDSGTASEIQDLLISMNKELGNLLIVVTHSKELAKGLDCAVEMQPGGMLHEYQLQ